MKILSIGNSFSTDAQRWLHSIAKSAGEDIYCANLYIGGCSLERHRSNFLSGETAYDYEVNGAFARRIALVEALKEEAWDVITLQQVSGMSGIYESFEPYLSELIRVVRENSPQAEILLHKTWAYDPDSSHPDFVNYDRSDKKMDDAITKAYAEAAGKTGLRIIPTGDAVRYLRENVKEFDLANGGRRLTRDSFHLDLVYGRFAAGLVWFRTLTGRKAADVSFVPREEGIETDPALLEIIKTAVDRVL